MYSGHSSTPFLRIVLSDFAVNSIWTVMQTSFLTSPVNTLFKDMSIESENVVSSHFTVFLEQGVLCVFILSPFFFLDDVFWNHPKQRAICGSFKISLSLSLMGKGQLESISAVSVCKFQMVAKSLREFINSNYMCINVAHLPWTLSMVSWCTCLPCLFDTLSTGNWH